MMRSWTPTESLIVENARAKATKAAMAKTCPSSSPVAQSALRIG